MTRLPGAGRRDHKTLCIVCNDATGGMQSANEGRTGTCRPGVAGYNGRVVEALFPSSNLGAPMRTFARGAVVVAVLLAVWPARSPSQEGPKTPGPAGIWLGPVNIGGKELRLAFHLKLTGAQWTDTMDSLDQGVNGLPADEVSIKDDQVRFGIKLIQASFEGKLNKEKTEIVGEFKQGGLTLPLTLKKVDKLPTPARPQEPK